jgi:hypothetical protein
MTLAPQMGRFCRLAAGRPSSRTDLPLHHKNARRLGALNMAAKPPNNAASKTRTTEGKRLAPGSGFAQPWR